MSYRVAITGVGVVSCLGIGLEALTASLREGRSGVVADPERVERGFRSPLTGTITGFNAQDYLTRKQRKTLPEHGIWAYAAVEEALRMASLDHERIKGPQTGIIFGCDSSSMAVVGAVDTVRASGGTRAIGGGAVFGLMTSCVSMNLSSIFATQGAAWTVSAACASGALALGQAAQLIALGQQERVLCGGAQEINWESTASFDAIGAFSLCADTPETASKPFDAKRDGLVPSGGAAALVLERRDLALKRNATIFGEVLGYGFASDGDHLTVPTGTGLTRAIVQAMHQAGLRNEDIDYICAHATATPKGDEVEARVLNDLFGAHRPPVSSLKSMTGHELWMAGASQAVSCVAMAASGFLAPNINFTTPDANSPDLNIITTAVSRPPRKALCNAAGFGGTNAALILGFEP